VEHTVLETLVSCPLCSGSPLSPALSVLDHTVSKEVFHLVDCPSCGARTTNPRPDQHSISAYYNSPDYISHTNTAQSLQDRLYQLARKNALRTKHKLIHRIRPNGRLLDIGCGTGEFLGYMKSRGYLTQGIEVDLRARKQAIANHNLDVVPNLDALPAQEQFQVVTMWHVLEHVPDPKRTLKKIYSLLADRGLLVIAVPDRDSWDAEHYGPDWAAYDVPRHLNHFRRADVHKLLHEHGFSMIRTAPMWLDAPYIAMLSQRYRGNGTLTALIVGTLLGLWSNALALLGSRPTSSTLYIAEKQEP
jgi:SAM-dependent methyltransferase